MDEIADFYRSGTPAAMEFHQQAALRNVQSLVEKNQRGNTAPDGDSARSRPVKSVGVLGAGMMGSGIAAVHLKHGLPVVITDVDGHALAASVDKIAAELDHDLPAAEARDRVDRLLRLSSDSAAVARCDLVIESVVESPAAKQRLYDQLQPHLAAGAILASNTSTIPIGRLAAGLSSPGRFCGMHFFHPVRQRPLVEIIRGNRTSDHTIATAVAHARAIDKLPIVVNDGPGFLVNRLLLPYLGEAVALLLEGATIEQIERAATDFGMAKGPLNLLDEIGLDTTLRGGWVLADAFSDCMGSAPLLVAMVKAGRLGRKSGAGFFAYGNGSGESGPGRLDEAIEPIIAHWARQRREHTARSITDRLLLPMVLEATRILEQGMIRDPRDIDLCVLFALGFPATRGGLLWWADTLSAPRVVAMLEPFQRLGPRYHPTPLLHELAQTSGHFYSDRFGQVQATMD